MYLYYAIPNMAAEIDLHQSLFPFHFKAQHDLPAVILDLDLVENALADSISVYVALV